MCHSDLSMLTSLASRSLDIDLFNSFTIRIVMWRFGLIANCGIDQTISFELSVHVFLANALIHDHMGPATGLSGTSV